MRTDRRRSLFIVTFTDFVNALKKIGALESILWLEPFDLGQQGNSCSQPRLLIPGKRIPL
jgi:hypothetical protein